MVRDHRPTLLLLQELSLREEGLPPDQVRATFDELLPRDERPAYDVHINGPYVALSLRSRVQVESSVLQLADGRPVQLQPWRQVQLLQVRIDRKSLQWFVVNAHLVSSGRKWTKVHADHGRGRLLGRRRGELQNNMRCARIRNMLRLAAIPRDLGGPTPTSFGAVLGDLNTKLELIKQELTLPLVRYEGRDGDWVICGNNLVSPGPSDLNPTAYKSDSHYPVSILLAPDADLYPALYPSPECPSGALASQQGARAQEEANVQAQVEAATEREAITGTDAMARAAQIVQDQVAEVESEHEEEIVNAAIQEQLAPVDIEPDDLEGTWDDNPHGADFSGDDDLTEPSEPTSPGPAAMATT